VGRGHLTRLVFAAALAAAGLAAAVSAALPFQTVASGRTAPVGRAPTGYLALSRSQERTWLGRLEADDRTTIRAVAPSRKALLAVFLDGLPCARRVSVDSLAPSGRTLIVEVEFTRPTLGTGTCVSQSTIYFVVGIPHADLGKTPPTRVTVVARARA
jgi:hypothetical protein